MTTFEPTSVPPDAPPNEVAEPDGAPEIIPADPVLPPPVDPEE